MNITEILGKAFDIGNNITFTVMKYVKDKIIETLVLTYIELGLFLISNKDNLSCIKIMLKE